MRLAGQDLISLSDYTKTSIKALSICFVHASFDSSAPKLRKQVCRAVAGKDTCVVTSSGHGVFSASHYYTSASLLPVTDVQGKAGQSRCSALPESNGVWTAKGSAANQKVSSDGQWSERDSWSVQKPLQSPLEDAIHQGNWLEARGYVDKLLSVGTLQDFPSLDKLIKGNHDNRPHLQATILCNGQDCMQCVSNLTGGCNAGLCMYGQFQTGWRLFKSCTEAYHPLGYSTYQTMITSAFKVALSGC